MTPYQKLIIVADDLTGAADCAARCRSAGLSTTVALDIHQGDVRPSVVDRQPFVLSCSSDSRHLPPAEAALRVAETVRLLLPRVAGQPITWYKKIDSTLRGNLGAELDAMLDALGAPCALVCPAFPAQGRGLRGGSLVAPTVAGAGPHLPTLLREQSARPVAEIPLEAVRAGLGPLAEALAAAHRSGGTLLVADGMTDDDLGALVAAAAQALPGALLCGSAGLVGTLAVRLPGDEWQGAAEVPNGPTLIVVGSGSPAAHRQIAYLRERTGCALQEVEPGRWALGNRGIAQRPAPSTLLLHQAPPPPGARLDGPEARRRAEGLAAAARDALGRLQPGLVVLVGGDTAGAVLARLGVPRLTVLRELLPGMPLAWGEDASGRGRHFILKAGNHGDDGTLVELLKIVDA